MTHSEIDRVMVAGATGNQGGAVVDALLALENPPEVRGLTRDRSTKAARELADRGVDVVEGDLEDSSTLVPLLEDVDAVFSVTNFWTLGYDRQVRQGKNLNAAAEEAGVEFLVLSGVGSHDQDTGIPHFDSAWEIDRHLQKTGVPNTVLKPVFFLQNFEPMAEDILDGTLAFPLEEGVSLQMIDVKDVGRIAARVLSDPDEYAGRRFDLAGDEHTLAEAAEIFSGVTGVDVSPYYVSIEDAREQAGDEWADMCAWFNEVGYSADVEGLETTFGLELTGLEAYLRREGWGPGHEPSAIPGWVKAMQGSE